MHVLPHLFTAYPVHLCDIHHHSRLNGVVDGKLEIEIHMGGALEPWQKVQVQRQVQVAIFSHHPNLHHQDLNGFMKAIFPPPSFLGE
mmetsp:Transcript_4033/g.2380  ORF Transcript_4033/g.2380 Transcript_4033/m.2380 type:complete len:87 (-) Transcript_4033:50-310(-)